MPEPGNATLESALFLVKARGSLFMSTPSTSPRVLCVTLRDGSVGHVVLDGFGVADGSFFVRRFDHLLVHRRFAEVLRLLRSSYHLYHPTRIVLGLPGRVRDGRRRIADRLAKHLASLGIEITVERLRDAAAVLVERVRFRTVPELVGNLAAHFVTSGVPATARTRGGALYWRPAWYAAALALAALVEHHPRVAAALAGAGAFRLPAFHRAVLSAEHRLTPLV